MILNKSMFRAAVLSTAMFLVLACTWQSMAGVAAKHKGVSPGSPSHSLEIQGAKDANQPVQKVLDQVLDTIFAKTKADFDKMAASPIVKSLKRKPVNGFFWKSLKTHQPWHSVFRTDKKGAVINEVIRIEGESKEKRSVAGEPWFAKVSKTMKEHLAINKNEKTGRYYLVWASPIISKVKGKETFQGAVVAQIDLWDCFDRYSDKSTTPFKVLILDRVVLYEHLWRDTIKYTEKRLTVPGIDKISVRYPRIVNEAASAYTVDPAVIEQARLDSIQAKTARDAAAAKTAAAKKAKSRNAIIIVVMAIFGLLLLVAVVVGVVMMKNRRRKEETGVDGRQSRFGNL
jgi:hypothetical protein